MLVKLFHLACRPVSNESHLWPGTADLAHLAVVELGRLWRHLGLQLGREHFLTLPGDARLRRLLLLVVVGGSTVQGGIVAWTEVKVGETTGSLYIFKCS